MYGLNANRTWYTIRKVPRGLEGLARWHLVSFPRLSNDYHFCTGASIILFFVSLVSDRKGLLLVLEWMYCNGIATSSYTDLPFFVFILLK